MQKPFTPQSCCCRTGFPLLENETTRRSGCRGHRRVMQTIAAAHGLFRPATHQRYCTRLDLWPDRHWLHHGLRHRRHDQFRPWRYLHDRRLHRADQLPDPGLDRPHRGSRDPADRSSGIDGDHRPLWLDRGTHRPQAAGVKPVPPIITGGYTLFDRDGFVVRLSNVQIIVVITTIVLLAIFTWLVAKTRLGRDMRACEQDTTMAALLGVDVDRTISMTFVIGAALAAVAGMMYLLYY